MSNSDKELDEILHDLIERASNTTAVNLHDHNLTPEAKQRLNALIEKKVREARIYELERLLQSNPIHGHFLKYSGNEIADRIAQLQDNQAKDEK